MVNPIVRYILACAKENHAHAVPFEKSFCTALEQICITQKDTYAIGKVVVCVFVAPETLGVLPQFINKPLLIVNIQL